MNVQGKLGGKKYLKKYKMPLRYCRAAQLPQPKGGFTELEQSASHRDENIIIPA
jgi:hypothetical protein